MADPALGSGASSSRRSYRLTLNPRRLLKRSSKNLEPGGTTAKVPRDDDHEARNSAPEQDNAETAGILLTTNQADAFPSPAPIPATYRIASRQDLWKRAYDLLQQNEPDLFTSLDEVLENNIRRDGDSTIQYRVSLIIDKNLEIMRGKEWTVPWGKQSVKVNEQVNKILKALVKFKDAGSFVTGFDPTHNAGLAWAGISAILPLILTGFEQQTATLDGLETISNLITRYTGIEATFTRKDVSVLGADLEVAIIKLYAEILHFQARAAFQFGRRTFSRMTRNTLGVEDWVGIRKKILDADEVCRHLMDVVNISRVDALHDMIESQHQESVMLRSTNNIQIEFDALLPELRDWIDPPVYEADLANILEPQQNVKSSSRWILEQHEVKQWVDGPLQNLWICGRPGSGKSVMAALVTSQLQQQNLDEEKETSKLHIGAVFCRTSDTTKRTAVAVISILVWQLLARGADLDIEQKRHVVLGWKAISNPSILRKNVARAMENWLLNLLAFILKSFDRTYLIVDGLDECDDAVHVIEALRNISSGIAQMCELRFLIVSQRTSDIEDQLASRFRKVNLDDASLREKSNNDIDLVVSSILLGSKAPNITKNFEFLKTTIVRKADGMILWATLVAKHLLSKVPQMGKYDELAVSDMMDELPSDISLLFGHLLQRCLSITDNLEKSPILRILQWSIWSARPLHIQELEAALGILTDLQEIQSLRYQIETFCSPLIAVQQDDTIIIVHTTFRRFIQQPPEMMSQTLQNILSFLDESKACSEIARACLTYLNQQCFESYTEMMGEISEVQDFDEEHKFFNYATLNWVYHWKLASSEGRSELVKLFNSLLTSGQGLTWLEGYQSRRGNTSPDLQMLQANVNNSFREPLNYQWAIDLFRRLVEERQDVFGLDEPSTRFMTGQLAWLLKRSGRIEQAITLYGQLLEGGSPAAMFETRLPTVSNLALAKADLGDLSYAQQTLERALENYKTTAGQYAPETLTSMSNLATIYNQKYQLAEAESLLTVVIQQRLQTLGEAHDDTLTAMNNLAWTLQHAGRLQEAKELLLTIVTHKTRRFGANSLDTLRSEHNLATISSDMGQLPETERLQRKILQIQTSMLGPMHIDTLFTHNNLAFTLQIQTKHEEAARMYEIGMDRFHRLLGPNHPSTLTAKQNLAATYESLHRYKESDKLHNEALLQREKVFGPNHYLTLASRSHVASLTRESGDFEKATKLELQVLNWEISNFGASHRSTLDSLSSLAFISFERGFPNLAAELIAQQLPIREKNQNRMHPNTITTRAVLGIYKSACGQWAEAESVLRESLADAFKILGEENRDYLGNMRHLGQTLRRQGRLQEAEEVLVPLLKTYERLESQSQRHRISAQFQLAWLRYDQERLIEARILVQQVIESYELIHDKGYYLAILCQNFLSKVLLKLGDLVEAQNLQETVVESRRAFYGSGHHHTLASECILALIYHARGIYDKCEASLLSLIPGQLQVLGLWHPDTLASIESLSILYRDQGQFLKAVELCRIVVEIREEVFNKNHPDLARSKECLQFLETTGDSKSEGVSCPMFDKILQEIKVARSLTQKCWILRRLVQEMEIVFGADHGHTVQAKQNLANFEMENGRYESVEETLRMAWRFHQGTLEQTDKTTLTSLLHLARCWKKSGTFNNNLDAEAPDAMLWAVQTPHKELFNLLVDEKFSIDREWNQETTPLFLASKSGYEGMVVKLLRAGAKPLCSSEFLTPLHVAAQKGHHMIVKYLLDHGADVNALSPQGVTALSYACANGHHATVKKILAFKPDLEIASQSSSGALHVAAEKGHVKCVELLLAAGTNIDRLSPKGNTALYGACFEGHLEIVKLILNHQPQPNINMPREGILPLHIAACNGFMDIVVLLVQAGAELEIPCFNLTPLCVAVTYGRREIVEYLVEKGASVTTSGSNIVIPSQAAEKGFLDILRFFLDRNIDINMLNTKGDSLLAVAVSEGRLEIVKELLKRGAPIDFRSSEGYTAFYWACMRGYMEIAQLLLDAGADIGALTDKGYAPVHVAAQCGHLDILDMLLLKGADASSLTGDSTALQLAIRFGQTDTAKRLIQAGVDVNTTSRRGTSALFLTVQHDNFPLLSLLLEHGADPNLGTALGISPLIFASFGDNLEAVKRLALFGSTVINFQSVRGTTALMCASAKGNLPMVEFLLGQGADPNILVAGNATALTIAAQRCHGDVFERLLPLVTNTFLRDWCGKNAFDWAFDDLACFIDKTKWIDTYIPTDLETQKRTVKQNIASITTSLLTKTYENDPLFFDLGRGLIILGNEAEADHAFQLDVSSAVDPEVLTYYFDCELCSSTNVVDDLFICLECAECKLCGKCMASYRAGSASPKACGGHEFHKVEGRHWKGGFETPRGFVNTRGQTLKEWLIFIRGLYEDCG